MDNTKKKTIRRYIGWAILALVVVWLAAMPLLARQGVQDDGPVASVLTATADSGTIRTAIHGGGTLRADEPEEVTVPKDVKITEFLVNNGDMVSEGDALAAVDKVSVMTAITGVQDSMATLRKQMESVRDEKADTTISAAAGGRVKVVYAQTGDRVESVMLQHGALAVLSLDNKMCVTLEVPASLSTGDSVTVTLENGKAVKGFVESNLSGKITVTVEDEGFEPGQSVTVEGLGEGILEIHSPWAATAFTGQVSAVKVKPNQVLSSGASLFTLTDTDYTAQRELLASTHREYEELLQTLFQMYDTGLLTAPCDGMVSGIDKDSTHLLAAVEEEELIATPLTAQEGGFRLVMLGNVSLLGNPCPDCDLPGTDPGHDPGCPHACNHGMDCTANSHFSDCPHNCTGAIGCQAYFDFHKDNCPEKCTANNSCQVTNPEKHQPDCPRRCTNQKNCTAAYHKDTCPEKCTNTAECKAGIDNHLITCPKYCSKSESCTASEHRDGCPKIVTTTYLGFVGVVKEVNLDGNKLMLSVNTNKTATITHTNKWDFGDLDLTNTSGMIPHQDPYSVPDASIFSVGDIVVVAIGEDGTQQIVPTGRKSPSAGGNHSGNPDFSSLMGGMSGFGGMGGMYGATDNQSQLYDLTGDVLLSVTPQEEMTLTVAVDESDISSISLGMEAEITVNALPGEVFTGFITHISRSGTGNGGSSKFAVELTLPHESQMLSGMSASAVLPLSEKSGILTLPAAAIVEEGGKTLVYTAADKKTGEPISPVEVTTGVSDGENVEILSGLQKGDTVYYQYYDTPEESDAVEINRIPMM